MGKTHLFGIGMKRMNRIGFSLEKDPFRNARQPKAGDGNSLHCGRWWWEFKLEVIDDDSDCGLLEVDIGSEIDIGSEFASASLFCH
jgi:hypothetical protein